MKAISVILYFLSHSPMWSFLVIVALGILCSTLFRKFFFSIVGFILAMLNIFTGHMLNAWFLNANGQLGTAIITQSERTNSTLNDQYIYDYDVVVKTADGKDVVTGFSTMSAAIYPIRNAILIPPDNELFYVKYIPGYEKNIVILSDLSAYGRQRLMYNNRQPVVKAQRQYEASPANETFRQEYLQALRTYIADTINAGDAATLEQYRQEIGRLEQRP